MAGNFSLSFRPESFETLFEGEKSLGSEWSEELEGGKAVRLTGIFDKLSYGVKKALSIESVKVSLTTTYCSVTSESQCVGKVHFLIHSIRREVSIIRPDASSDVLEKQKACIALREQKEIFLLPTVQVSNFLSSEAAILLTETGNCRKVCAFWVTCILPLTFLSRSQIRTPRWRDTALANMQLYRAEKQLTSMLIQT
jgi:hypothetical protein